MYMLNLKMFTASKSDMVSMSLLLADTVPVVPGFFCQELLKAVNPEGDGYITIDEFYSAMKRPGVVDG